MSGYKAMKDRQQTEVNAFPMFFAFHDKQFGAGMAKLGLTLDDTDKIYSLGSTGGYYRRADAPALHEMFDRHEKELADAIMGDVSGDGFIFDMFMCEMGNHEFTYTNSLEETLDALNLVAKDIEENSALRRGLTKACQTQRTWARKNRCV
jgi:hypothetical protein